MRIIEPHQLYSVKKHRAIKTRKKVLRSILYGVLVIIVLFGSLGLFAYMTPIPKVSASAVTIDSHGENVDLPWPTYGQSAIGAQGHGVLGVSNSKKPVPTASVIKIMTALAVLKAKPLAVHENGPSITISQKDINIFSDYVAKGGSVIPVELGEKISERQAIEAMLLPSANNIADTLVNWAFGSIGQYSAYANNYALQLGLSDTTITSASGYPPDTTSTATDLVKIGIAAMEHPVISKIVSQPYAKVPVAGKILNYNYLLGKNNIVGLKTGSTDEAGGCYLFAARRQILGQNVTVVGAVLGANNLIQAMHDSRTLLASSFENFENRRLVNKGDKLGYYNLPWGGDATATAANDLNVIGWKGSNIKANVALEKITIANKLGSIVGDVRTSGQSVQLLLNSDIAPPTQSWRVFRWF